MAEAAAVVGLVASIASLVDLSAKVASRLRDFTSKSSDVPESFRSLSTRLPLLTATLQHIRSQAEAGHLPEDVTRALDAVVDNTSEQISTVQTSLSKILPSDAASKLERALKALKSLAKEDKRDILPESSNGSVLITSRSREAAFELVGEDENILKVEPMSEGYALALFQKKLKGEDNEDDVLELLRNLEYMPLAISQAAAYVRQRAPRVTVSKYLKDFRRSEKDRASLLNNAVRDRRRDGSASNSVLATWQISFEYIRSDRPSAARLLSLMSFFDRQGIPEELIMSRYEEDDSIVDFEEDVEVLRSFSLVALGIKNDVFEMHRLVQFATRKWLEQRQELERWKERYIAIMADAFPPGKYENWKRCQMLFPHAELVTEYRPIEESFLQRWTAILSNAAWYAAEQGRYDEAEQMDRRALDGREKVLGKEHPDTLMSVSNLALVLQYQGKYDEAEQINRQALDGREKVLGKEHPDTLTSVYCLAYLLRQQQKYRMARPLYERALVGYRKVLRLNHPTTTACSEHYTSLLQELDEMRTAS
ncbi:MAG: hypothetical protein Q9164_006593 [Protoblastenia rupestris]